MAPLFYLKGAAPFPDKSVYECKQRQEVYAMGINTITQAFEKTEREKEGKIKTYKIVLCLSLGLNIVLIVLILSGI